MNRSVSSLCSLETITEEFIFARESALPGSTFLQSFASVGNEDYKECDPVGFRAECPSVAPANESMHRTNKASTDPVIGKMFTLPNGPFPADKMNEKTCNDKNALSYAGSKPETNVTLKTTNMKPGMSLLADVSRENTKNSLLRESPGERCHVQINGSTMAHKVSKPPDQQLRHSSAEQPLIAAVLRPRSDRLAQQPSMARAGPPVPVRRAKSENQVISRSSTCQSPMAEVYSDATSNDKIWSKLELNSHRDSMSSSSSKSSNDTVIDLSLPNLARKSLLNLDIPDDHFESIHFQNAIRPRSATALTREVSLGVTKSKSNPNLISGNKAIDNLYPRPLARSPEEVLPPLPRRNTWNRLYVESLKQVKKKPNSDIKPSTTQSMSMSKSLGDLTSDDISCNFESKYRSISRSFITRSMRAQRRPGGVNASSKSTDSLTEQLRKLTSFEKENDITSPTDFHPVQYEDDSMNLLRRTSSRSQSRVRYIANRAKQAQERQRLQNLVNSNSIEERGNPEGACAITKGFCMDSLSPTQFTSEPFNKFGQ